MLLTTYSSNYAVNTSYDFSTQVLVYVGYEFNLDILLEAPVETTMCAGELSLCLAHVYKCSRYFYPHISRDP